MNSHSIRFGLIAGIGTVGILLSAYFIDKRLQLSPGVVWSTTFFYILGMSMAVKEVRKEQEGFITFREALKAAFIVWIVANAIYHLFNYVHFNFIDPEMLEIQKDFTIEQLNQGLLGEEMTEQMVEQIEQSSYNFYTTVSAYTMALLGGFLLSAIIARLMRRDKYQA